MLHAATLRWRRRQKNRLTFAGTLRDGPKHPKEKPRPNRGSRCQSLGLSLDGSEPT
jgi:hypothetical protein